VAVIAMQGITVAVIAICPTRPVGDQRPTVPRLHRPPSRRHCWPSQGLDGRTVSANSRPHRHIGVNVAAAVDGLALHGSTVTAIRTCPRETVSDRHLQGAPRGVDGVRFPPTFLMR
jgi:hypothetical protein